MAAQRIKLGLSHPGRLPQMARARLPSGCFEKVGARLHRCGIRAGASGPRKVVSGCCAGADDQADAGGPVGLKGAEGEFVRLQPGQATGAGGSAGEA